MVTAANLHCHTYSQIHCVRLCEPYNLRNRMDFINSAKNLINMTKFKISRLANYNRKHQWISDGNCKSTFCNVMAILFYNAIVSKYFHLYFMRQAYNQTEFGIIMVMLSFFYVFDFTFILITVIDWYEKNMFQLWLDHKHL